MEHDGFDEKLTEIADLHQRLHQLCSQDSLAAFLACAPQRLALETALRRASEELGALYYDRRTGAVPSTGVGRDEPSVSHGPVLLAPTEPDADIADAVVPDTPAKSAPVEVDLHRLKSAMTSPDWGSSAASPDLLRLREATARAVERLGKTPAAISKRARATELAKLTSMVDELPIWATLTREINHNLTAWVVARMRALQHAMPDDPELDGLFARLSAHSRSSQPGSINGLARNHTPAGTTWSADAQKWEAELRRFLASDQNTTAQADDAIRRFVEACRVPLSDQAFVNGVRQLLAFGVAHTDKRLARLAIPYIAALKSAKLGAVARAAERLAEEESRDEAPPRELIPESWQLKTFTRGKRVAIVGGEPRPERIERIKEAFEFSEVQWLANPNHAGRAVDSLVERMHHGTVDLVISLRAFSSHKVTDKLFENKHAAATLVLADSYGIGQIRAGLERFVDQKSRHT